MSNCPRCHSPLRRSEGGGGLSSGWPVGTVILVCTGCRQACIEGDYRWAKDGGNGLMDALRLLATAVKQERDVIKEIVESPIEDPRWTAIS